MKTEIAPTYWVRIYMSGSMEHAKQVIRRDVLAEGLCVTVEPTLFIYTGGEEQGFVVGLVNYPRFPSTPAQLDERAMRLADLLRAELAQHSVMVMNPSVTTWISHRATPTNAAPDARSEKP